MKKVGIIGGMGPLATVDLFKKIVDLTDAKTDQENVPLLIDNYPQFYDRTSFILGDGQNPLPQLVNSAKMLKNAGCEAICLACNTVHYFANDIEKQADVKILHIAKITIEVLEKKYNKGDKIAVLSTLATNKAGIYKKALSEFGFDMVDTSNFQDDITSCIYDGAKAGLIKEYSKKFENVLKHINAKVYILACTELPLFVPYLKERYNFIDPTTELAKKVIEFSKS